MIASWDFVHTSKSFFWPDVIMLAGIDLDYMQSLSMVIGVQRQTEMIPITILFAGINDHLHNEGDLSRLREPTTAEDAVWPDERHSGVHGRSYGRVKGRHITENNVLRELMSEDLLFVKSTEPDMTAVNFNDHFRDRIGEVDRGHIEVFQKLRNLRHYDKRNGETTKNRCLIVLYQKVRKENEDWVTIEGCQKKYLNFH